MSGAVATGVDEPVETNARRFGEPVPGDVTTSAVAAAVIAEATCEGDCAPLMASVTAATPATWGEAIEVPDNTAVAVVEVYQAEVMLDPGAKTSTHDPKLEYEARESVDVVAPTVMALATRAGE